MAARAHFGIAELMHRTRLDAATQLRGHGLHAVADAQHRHAQLEHRTGRGRRTGLRHRLRAARQDDALGREGANVIAARIPGVDLAVDTQFAHAARDELRVLRTEIQDQDAVGVDVGVCVGIGHLGDSISGTGRPNMARQSSQNGRFMDHLYSLYDALVSIHVPPDRARAVVDAMERDMRDQLATKTDLHHLRELLSRDIQATQARIDHQTTVMTVRLGSMIGAGFVLLYALQRLG